MPINPFPSPLCEGVLIRRYKRFLADIRFGDGRTETVHCPNPGAMTGTAEPGMAVYCSDSGNPRRKLRHTWELVRVGRALVCVNTQIGNRVVGTWLRRNLSVPVSHRGTVEAEVPFGGSRFDFRLDGDTLVEVKTVTLRRGRAGAFPDARTERGRRHLETLASAAGMRRVLLYFVARGDVQEVRPAEDIDPRYAAALRAARDAGVEILAVRAHFSAAGGVRRGPLLDVIV